MKEKQTKNMGLEVVAVILIGIILLPVSSAQDPPSSSSSTQKDCLFYSYTSSNNHFFLLQNNSSVFGSEVNIIHNCDNVEIRLNGLYYASSNNSFEVTIESGINNISIISEDENINYENVVFYPDILLWESEYEMLINPRISKEYIDLDLAESQQNWSVALGILMVWVLSTYVYWRLIQSYTDKNFIEEVVS